MKRPPSALQLSGCALLTAVAAIWMVTPAAAINVSDDFNTDANYAFGAVGGIWTGSENMLNLNGGVFNANLSNPGVLTVEDNGTFDADSDPGNGITGMGWEGGRSTSPFLFTDVPAGEDFTATVKISAQTSGNWSAAGIIARAANSPTPPGIGDNHADENFATMYSFRTNAAVPDEGNTLMKRIENGAQVSDVNIVVNAAGTEPLPLHLKLERVGGGTAYRGWVSTDGGATYQFQSRVTPTEGNPLRDPAVGLQVGLSYMNFGTLAGTTQFDDFTLETYEPLPAPGLPSISTDQTAFTLAQGTVLEQLITETTGNQGPLSWARTPNLPGNDAMLPGAQGGSSTLLTFPPLNQSYFRWDTANATTGTHLVTITATNDWGQPSNPVELTITIIPEPITAVLAAVVSISLLAVRRRRR